MPYTIITAQHYREIFAGRDLAASWRRFNETYPGATLLTLSAVGFDSERSRAVVQIGIQRGGLHGEWRDYYFDRRNDRWTVVPVHNCSAVS